MNSVVFLCVALLGTAADAQVNFDTEIVPVLTKSGCNAGACHGAAAGRGGFHLSLLGSDPGKDYQSIVSALEGRRINLARPELSLLLAKPTGRIEHGGDVALPEGEAGHQRLLEWIHAGAPRGPSRKLTSFELSPAQTVCKTLPAEVHVRALACFDGGEPEDVTAWVLLSAADKDALAIDSDTACVTVGRRGQHVIIARFLDRVVPVQINVPYNAMAVVLTDQPRANFIDDEILKTLSVLGLPISPPADDATFLRRVRLDLTGRLPTIDEIHSFLNDQRSDKRLMLIDDLLRHDDFADYWTLRFARHLGIHSLPNEGEGMQAYVRWLREGIEQDRALDAMGRELVTATGDSHEVGPANFGRMAGDARGHAELVGRFFLGARLGCANCHNHPLDKWTQDDYHGLAAVFAPLERGRFVKVGARGSVTNLRTGEPAIPRIPGVRYLDNNGDSLEAVAQWLTHSDENYFARATVNRLWSAMFGRGLVDAADDLRDSNPATHPKLLDRLAEDFIENGYRLRHTLRSIAQSHAYGRSIETVPENATDDRFYSHAHYRPMMPEVVLDAISDVTGVPEQLANERSGMRAVQLIDPLSPAPALDTLGRCTLPLTCDEVAGATVGVATQLHMINGQLINGKLADPKGHLQHLIAQRSSTEFIVRDFYLRAWSREPTRAELRNWSERLAQPGAETSSALLEDFVWTLLNSRAFLENH